MLGDTGASEELDRHLRLVRDQRQHDHLAGLLLLLGDQVVDRLKIMLLVQRQQVHVQDEQIPSHVPSLPSAAVMATRSTDSKPSPIKALTGERSLQAGVPTVASTCAEPRIRGSR